MVSLLNPEIYAEHVPAFVQDYIQALEKVARAADEVPIVPGLGGLSEALGELDGFVDDIEAHRDDEPEYPEGETPMLQEEDINDEIYYNED